MKNKKITLLGRRKKSKRSGVNRTLLPPMKAPAHVGPKIEIVSDGIPDIEDILKTMRAEDFISPREMNKRKK